MLNKDAIGIIVLAILVVTFLVVVFSVLACGVDYGRGEENGAGSSSGGLQGPPGNLTTVTIRRFGKTKGPLQDEDGSGGVVGNNAAGDGSGGAVMGSGVGGEAPDGFDVEKEVAHNEEGGRSYTLGKTTWFWSWSKTTWAW